MDIWNEEVDAGFLKLIPSVVTCEYEENVFTPIHASIGNPEQDFDDFHIYPRCSINSVGEEFSYNRNDNRNPVVTGIRGNMATVKDPSQPYYLIYNIVFYAKFKSDIDRITKLWRKHCGRAFSLPVTLADGSTYECRTDFLGQSQSDMLDREALRYTRSYLYRVWVDLEGETHESRVVTQLDLVKK